MRFGVEPDRMRSYASGNPARGKAQGRIGLPAAAGGRGSQMGVKAQKSNASPKTKSPADRLFEGCTPIRRSVTPTKINRGGRAASKRHVGPEGQKCPFTHPREQTCEGQKNPGAPPGEKRKEGGTGSPGKAVDVRTA
jgi:hypothetical protein